MTGYTARDHFVLLPAILLCLFGCAALLLEFLLPRDKQGRRVLVGISMAGLAFAGW